jgi:hypothetical protein
MKIEVIRGLGTKRAPDIIDELCTTDACGIKRGQNFLDEFGGNKKAYELEVAPMTTLPTISAMVGVQDASLGRYFSAKVTGLTLSVEGKTETTPLTVTTKIMLERSL